MSDQLSSEVARIIARTGLQVSVPLSHDLKPEDYSTLFEMVCLVLGPSFGVEVRRHPSPELCIWREQRGPQYDG